MSIHGLVNGFSSLSNLHCSPHFLDITQQRHMWEYKCPTHSDQTINTKSTQCSILEIWTHTWVAKVCWQRADWCNTQCPILYSPDSTFNIVFPVVRTHLTQTISCWELHMREQLCTTPCLDVFKSFYNWKQVSVDPCAQADRHKSSNTCASSAAHLKCQGKKGQMLSLHKAVAVF